MSKFQRSWELFKRSLQVIAENKKLMLFPVVVTFFTLLIVLFFLAPIALWDTGRSYNDPAHWKAMADRWVTIESNARSNVHVTAVKPATYVFAAGLYLLSTFLATFFNVAFFHEILGALNGRRVSITGGLRFALSRLKAILAWSLFTGLVGLVIKWLEERVGIVGRWVLRFIGIAWSVASIFAVPFIIREQGSADPVKLLKSSAGALKRTWGESLIGYLGIRLADAMIGLAFIGTLAVGAALAFWLKSLAVGIAIFAFAILALVVFGFLQFMASQVYLGALFIYATEGVIPGPFDKEQMDMAWKVKAGRKAAGA